MQKITELNGLRGIAALLVFLAHAAKAGFLPSFLEKQYGQIALLILFVLSGFLISHQYLSRDFTKENIYKYIVARASRVFPAYIMVLLLSYIVSSFYYPDFRYNFENEHTLFYALFFITAPYELWSIPVEVQFYATFILIWFVYQRFSKNFWVLLLIPLGMGALGINFYMTGGRPHTIWLFAITFFIGTAISFLVNNPSVFNRISKTPKALSISVFILTLTIIPLFRKVFGFHLAARLDPTKLILVVSTFLFIITNPANFRFLTLKPLLFMGEISFAFYLIHRPIIEMGKSFYGNTPFCFMMALAVTTTIAAFSTFIFEKPIMKMLKKIKLFQNTTIA